MCECANLSLQHTVRKNVKTDILSNEKFAKIPADIRTDCLSYP
jgi:hypothetical protein